MEYTVGAIIDKLLELSNGDRNMMVRGIRQLNCPNEKGSFLEYHNIGIFKIKTNGHFLVRTQIVLKL